MSRFCLKKTNECDIECNGDCCPDTIILGHSGKWRLEYEDDSVWIIDGYDTEIQYFWSLMEGEKNNLQYRSFNEKKALLKAFRLAVAGGYMDCPFEYSWLMDVDDDDYYDDIFLGNFWSHNCSCRCAWPTNGCWFPELIAESLRRAKMIGLIEADFEVKETLPEYKSLGSWGDWKLRYYYDGGYVHAVLSGVTFIDTHVSYKLGDDISELSYESINALMEAFRIAVGARLIDCPPEYAWMLEKNTWGIGSEYNRNYIWLGRDETIFGTCLSYPGDNTDLAIHRAKMLGFYKEKLDPTQIKVTYSYYSPDSEKLEDAVDLMRDVYDFRHWPANDDKRREIWEKVRNFLLENEKKG